MSHDADAEEATATSEEGSAGPDGGSDADAGAEGNAEVDGSLAAEADDVAARTAQYDEEIAADVADLGDRIAEVESDLAEAESTIEDLRSRLKRKQADFQNYKKRAKREQERLEERATEDFVSRIVSVRDNLVRALDQDDDSGLRDGLEGTLAEFDRILADENVEPIEPDPGEAVDPQRHEVMMRVESDRPSGTVVDVYRPGYEMADSVIQTAQVTVSEE